MVLLYLTYIVYQGGELCYKQDRVQLRDYVEIINFTSAQDQTIILLSVFPGKPPVFGHESWFADIGTKPPLQQ